VGAPGVGDLDQLGVGPLDGADKALVLELGQRRVHRAGARAPAPAAPLLDRLHQLIAVGRALGEQAQDGEADVATSPPTASSAPAARAEGTGAAERPAAHPAQGDQLLELLRGGPAEAAGPVLTAGERPLAGELAGELRLGGAPAPRAPAVTAMPAAAMATPPALVADLIVAMTMVVVMMVVLVCPGSAPGRFESK